MIAIPALAVPLMSLSGCSEKVTEKTGTMEQVKDKFPKQPGKSK